MYKMHVIDIFTAFYICEKIVLANIAKIKRSQLKDGYSMPHLITVYRENFATVFFSPFLPSDLRANLN